jgi:hypothetical protein
MGGAKRTALIPAQDQERMINGTRRAYRSDEPTPLRGSSCPRQD